MIPRFKSTIQSSGQLCSVCQNKMKLLILLATLSYWLSNTGLTLSDKVGGWNIFLIYKIHSECFWKFWFNHIHKKQLKRFQSGVLRCWLVDLTCHWSHHYRELMPLWPDPRTSERLKWTAMRVQSLFRSGVTLHYGFTLNIILFSFLKRSRRSPKNKPKVRF